MSFKVCGKLAIIEEEKIKRILIAGDLHGDLQSFNSIKKLFKPEKDLLIFLGDYADRGENGVEVIEGVRELIEKYEKNVVALKGNHEDYSKDGKPNFVPCTLISEVEEKIGNWEKYFDELKENFLSKLKLAALIPHKILFVHGGISSKIKSLKDLENPSKEIEEDILWSDPYPMNGEFPNPRGAGILFGPDITQEVTKRLNVKYVIRSHEPRKAFVFPAIEHEGKVITLSSTRVYGGKPFLIIIKPNVFESKNVEEDVIHLG